MDNFLQLDVGRFYIKIIQADKGRKEFGFFRLFQAAARNQSEQECEETLQADDADNSKRSFKRKIKCWCGYLVNWKAIYPNMELPDGKLDPIDNFLQLDVGRLYIKIIQADKGRKEFGFFCLCQAAARVKQER